MTHSPQIKFSFKNLQPINYLKTFNKMIDYQSKLSQNDNKTRQLKIVSLSKFPTPKDYQNMQGIFENLNKKKIENDMNKYNKELQQQQKFMKKHNQFMRKVLAKFIQHNQNRQKIYQKQKIFYKNNYKKNHHLRSISQSKLDKFKKQLYQDNIKIKTINDTNTDAKATLGSEITFEDTPEENSQQILPKLQPRKKKQKLTIKKQKQIEAYVVKRKLTNPQIISSPLTAHHQTKEDQNLDFRADIINLQKKQARIQANFSQRIEKQISQFSKKMNIQNHAINYYNFWKEPNKVDQAQQQKERRIKKMKQQVKKSQDRIDYKIKLGNIQFR